MQDLQVLLGEIRGVLERRVEAEYVVGKDSRDWLWEAAYEVEPTGPRRKSLMALLCWLYYKRQVYDLDALRAVAKAIGRAQVPYGRYR